MPVQIVIGANKEAILSEKHCTARFHQTVSVGFSEVLIPNDYPDFEAFMTKVQVAWDSEWNEVFTTSWEGLPVLPEVQSPQFDYPLDISIKMFCLVILNLGLAFWALKVFWCWTRAAMALLGPLQWPVATLVLTYVISSFYVYSYPVDALVVHENLMNQRKTAATAVVGGTAAAVTLPADGIKLD